jgi:hypothetical protein
LVLDFHPFSHTIGTTKAQMQQKAELLCEDLPTLRLLQRDFVNCAAGCTVMALDGSSMALPIMNAGKSMWLNEFFAKVLRPYPPITRGRILEINHACTLVSGRSADTTSNSITGWVTAAMLFSPGEFDCRCPGVLL